MEITIIETPFGSNAQRESIRLRYEILRKPLGLNYTKAQLDSEEPYHHIVAICDHKVVGCLVLVPSQEDNNLLKMKQLAVDINYQKQHIGTKLLQFCENFARNRRITTLCCHARETAVPFYKKLNWKVKGEQFEEIGIAHFYMVKKIEFV